MAHNKDSENPTPNPKKSGRKIKIENFKISEVEAGKVKGGRAMIDEGPAHLMMSNRK